MNYLMNVPFALDTDVMNFTAEVKVNTIFFKCLPQIRLCSTFNRKLAGRTRCPSWEDRDVTYKYNLFDVFVFLERFFDPSQLLT